VVDAVMGKETEVEEGLAEQVPSQVPLLYVANLERYTHVAPRVRVYS
jgi:hypothetical protein